VAIPFYAIVQGLELLDTHEALILVYLAFTFPFTIYFLSVYFRHMPPDVEEAALLDGCNRFNTFLRVEGRHPGPHEPGPHPRRAGDLSHRRRAGLRGDFERPEPGVSPPDHGLARDGERRRRGVPVALAY
jgi:hypothetical protein